MRGDGGARLDAVGIIIKFFYAKNRGRNMLLKLLCLCADIRIACVHVKVSTFLLEKKSI